MPRSARTEGYSRRHRFSARGSFGTVLRGSRKLRGRLAILHVAPSPDGVSRLGIALTKRLVPASVDRNRVKRMVREAFRRHPAKATGLDCVVALRERFAVTGAAPVVAEIRGLLDQLCGQERR
jgi:ribonuclease P protein component